MTARCPECGTAIVQRAGKGRPRIYCSDGCRGENQRRRDQSGAEPKWRRGPAPGAPCERIGCPRESKERALCHKHYQQLRRGATSPTRCRECGGMARRLPQLCSRCADRKPDPVCLTCGEVFARTSPSAKFCCRKHRDEAYRRTPEQNRIKNHKRRAAKYGAGYERFSAMDIFERDGWRCHLCGKKVRKPRFPRDPQGPSLDHLIPLSMGGPHSAANARLAHLRCNAARGVRGDVQLLLVA